MKTSELSGPALDWAVAKCELPAGWLDAEIVLGDATDYSTNWAHGGPIIEREGIDLNFSNYDGTSGEMWDAACEAGKIFGGPTPLVAAMRCFVASRLGDEVEIPEGLQ